jgi:hypothetical protein
MATPAASSATSTRSRSSSRWSQIGICYKYVDDKGGVTIVLIGEDP